MTEIWPKTGPDFNEWNKDADKFLALISKHPHMWCYDTQLKYLNMRIDTRSGNFILHDRDGNKVQPERAVEAIRKAKRQ